MTIRIPSSIKWLVTKFQHKQRELMVIEAEIKALEQQRDETRTLIESLRQVIDVHEIPISACEIPQLRKNKKRTSLGYGAITRFIYQYLDSLDDTKDASVSEVFFHCVDKSNWDDFSPRALNQFRKAVRQRLQNMALQGKIVRSKEFKKSEESRYKKLP